jgi:hypothetical protein
MRWSLGIGVVTVLVVGIAAYAVGAAKSSSDVTLCAVNKGGELSLTSHGKCGKGEKKLTIAKQGPQGAPGPQGAAGPAGSAANVVPEAIHYVTHPGTTACQANPGTFCKPENLSGEFENYSELWATDNERVGYYKSASGVVHLTGVAEWGSSGGSAGGFVPEGPFYLPSGYRPAHIRVFSVPGGSGGLDETRAIQIRPDGLVYAPGTWNPVSLDGVTFRP